MNITIVGAGVSGLTCAVRLLDRGHRVAVIGERRTPDTTSDRSAAAFTPFRGSGNADMRRWTLQSYDTFRELANEHGEESGVRACWMTEFFYERLDALPWWMDLVEGAERVAQPPARYADGIRALMTTMDMKKYMPWLESRVLELGGTLATGKAGNLREPFTRGADLVVNASGMGARELVPDAAMIPMRGQVMHVENDIALDECFTDSGGGAESTYVFPFERHIVLGGTCERGEERDVVDEESLAKILERCRTLLQEANHPRWSDLGRTRLHAWAGLRPARVIGADDAAICVELEMLDARWPVIHDYGHGRLGVTVSWGTAEEVAEIAETLR